MRAFARYLDRLRTAAGQIAATRFEHTLRGRQPSGLIRGLETIAELSSKRELLQEPIALVVSHTRLTILTERVAIERDRRRCRRRLVGSGTETSTPAQGRPCCPGATCRAAGPALVSSAQHYAVGAACLPPRHSSEAR